MEGLTLIKLLKNGDEDNKSELLMNDKIIMIDAIKDAFKDALKDALKDAMIKFEEILILYLQPQEKASKEEKSFSSPNKKIKLLGESIIDNGMNNLSTERQISNKKSCNNEEFFPFNFNKNENENINRSDDEIDNNDNDLIGKNIITIFSSEDSSPSSFENGHQNQRFRFSDNIYNIIDSSEIKRE